MTPLIAPLIAGAGLSGLLAAHAWPGAQLFDPQSGPRAEHRAVLRFRSDAVALLTGIDFTPVTVRKGIWLGGKFVGPSIGVANMYSRKILGRIDSERSIWRLDPAQRFIAPETFYERLVAATERRIHWGETIGLDRPMEVPVISTMPIPVLLNELGLPFDPSVAFERQPIAVTRFRVPACNVYQTIYFPDPEIGVYRASITKDLLIVEGVKNIAKEIVEQVFRAFGLGDAEFIDTGVQKYGKIVPLDDDVRTALLMQITDKYNVYSLGRFATWRNVLLDDVVKDIAVIRRLLRSSRYERSLFAVSPQ